MLTKLYIQIQGYLTKDDGATAIEYGLIAAGIAVAISAAVFAFGTDLTALFTSLGDSLEAPAAP